LAGEAIRTIETWTAANNTKESDVGWRALYRTTLEEIERFREDPDAVVKMINVEVPPGSPIGAASCR